MLFENLPSGDPAFHTVSSETKTGTRRETKQTNPLVSAYFAKRPEMMKHAVRLRARYRQGNDSSQYDQIKALPFNRPNE
jgi:hypothetical protein